MNVLVIKKWLSKAWLWLKNYWYIPLSLLAIGVSSIFFKEKAASLTKAFMENRESYKEQAKKVDEIHENEIKERNSNLNIMSKELKKEQARHDKAQKKIEKNKKSVVKELKGKDLAKELDKEFDL